MSGKTEFAGFEYLDPGDSLSDDGYYFQSRNPVLADRLARLGARDHRHDEHAALVDPSDAPTVTISAGDGALPGGAMISVTYTLHDSDGGETLPVAAIGEPTPDGFTDPTASPDVVVDYIAGTLIAGTISYALTVTDGAGGETGIGPASLAVIVPGHANAEVVLSGLAAILADASGGAPGAAWRLWRSMGGNWYLIATGTDDTFTDDGVAGDCSIEPPSIGTTVGANALHVTVPGGQPAGTVAYSIYASYDGTFTNPCLLGTYDIASAGTVHDYTSLDALTGAPPARSTCYAGAHKIDQDAETTGPWRGVVATAADLPSVGNTDGDVRVTLDDHALHVWDDGGGVWDIFSGGGGGARGSLWYADHGAPGAITGQLDDDMYLDMDSGDFYQLVSGVWTLEGNLTGPTGPSGGTRGSLWYVDHGAPGAIGGQLDDDMYLDVDSGDYYRLVSGVWTLEGNLTGPTGPPGGGSATLARAYVNAAVTPAAAWQKLLLDTVSFDTDGGFDLANNRYVVPADGYYQINANVLTQGHTAAGIAIYKNGVAVTKGSSGPSPDGWAGFQLADIMECVAGDELELWGYFGGGDPLDVEAGQTNYLSLVKV